MTLMKKIALFTFISLISCVCVISGADASQQTIKVNKTCESLPGLTMTQVTITDDQTRVDFEWQNSDSDYAISIYAPGDESAFVIKDTRSSKAYKLQSAEGIVCRP